MALAIFISGCTTDVPAKAAAEAPKAVAAPTLKLPAGSSAIEGYVLDDEMVPIVGAEVSIRGLPLATLSRIDGRFFLGPMTPGNHELVAQHAGHGTRVRSFATPADETLLVAVVLYPVPLPQAHETLVAQKGLLACGVAAQAQLNGAFMLYTSDLYHDCALRPASAAHLGRNPADEIADRSGLAWVVDHTEHWTSASFEVRWTQGSAFANRLSATVSGLCGSKAVTFLTGSGPSPLRLTRAAPGIETFLKDSGTEACGSSAACDGDGCSLASLVRAAPTPQGTQAAASGFALQQAFEATLRIGYGA